MVLILKMAAAPSPSLRNIDGDILEFSELEKESDARVECRNCDRIDAIFPFEFCDLCVGLTEQIPSKVFSLEKGFLNERVSATCLDADDIQIAVGTNVGNVYIFNRQQCKMFAIKGRDQIVCLKLAHNTEYSLLGVGLRTGAFVALQLPSSADGKSRKLIQKVLTDVHRCGLTCMEWSSDGRKLFTGDASGLIMMTLLDFENGVFDSSFIYCDSGQSAIVQLSYWGNLLSACTGTETFLVDIANDCQVSPIGSRGRNGAAPSGGVAFVGGGTAGVHHRPDLYVSRPGCRLWRVRLDEMPRTGEDDDAPDDAVLIAETQDYHQSTLSSSPLSLPTALADSTSSATPLFGQLHYLRGADRGVLVTHADRQLYLIDLPRRALVGRARFRYPIASLSVCSRTNEIFILLASHDSTPLILRISSLRADPWLVTPTTEGKRAEKCANSASSNQSAVGMKDLLTRLKAGSTQIADVLSLRDMDSSTPNFQVCLNKLRASSVETTDVSAIIVAEDCTDTAVLASSCSRSSTPDSFSLASGGGSAPPWCLDDQSVSENALLSSHVNVIKGKKTGKKMERKIRVKDAKITVDCVQTAPCWEERMASDAGRLENARLTTPTEEAYLMNRFNPFDNSSTAGSGTATREQLEALLESTLLRAGETEVTVREDRVDCADEAGQESPRCSDRPAVESDDKPTVAASFRQLLLNETRRVANENELIQPADKACPPTSPDDSYGDPALGWAAGCGLDIWCQVNHHRPIVYIAGCDRYLVFVDVDQACRYFPYARSTALGGGLLPSTSGKGDAWCLLREKADAFAVSPNGRIVWRVLDQVAFAQLRPSVHSPCGRNWCEAGSDVSTKVAVSNSSAWYLKTDGTVCAQAHLRADRPCYKIVHIDSEWPLVQLSCVDDVVWGLRQDGRLVVRIGIKLPDCPTGHDWIDFVPDGPSEVVALHLHEDTAWVVDTEGRLWFCCGVSNRYPIGTTGRWWQVSLPSSLAANSASRRRALPHAVCVTSMGVHLAVDRSVWYCRTGVTGHRWARVVPVDWALVDKFRHICASCLADAATDYIWLTRPNNELMLFQPRAKHLQSLESPCVDAEIVSMSGVLSYVWLLDASGRVFVRCGAGRAAGPSGSRWQQLDMTQFDSGSVRVKFVSISCSVDAVWACDQLGAVYVRLGAAPPQPTHLPSAWIRLEDDGEQTGNRKRDAVIFTKVFCTPDGEAVWALTGEGRIYVRLGVTKEVPVGNKWLEIEDMQANALAVSAGCAWALSDGCVLYQRYGITPMNPAGNFWKPLDCKLQSIAATPAGCLWALDADGRLVRHQKKTYSWSRDDGPEKGAQDAASPADTDGTGFGELTDYEVI